MAIIQTLEFCVNYFVSKIFVDGSKNYLYNSVHRQYNPFFFRNNTMTKTEFIRAFLLELDVLGVYHPDNQNEDEYDAYIDGTIEMMSSRTHAKTFATTLVYELTECGEVGVRWTGCDYKIPMIIEKYKAAKKEFKKLS